MTRLGCEAEGGEWAAVHTRVERRMSCVVRLGGQLSVYAPRRERPPGKYYASRPDKHTRSVLWLAGDEETKNGDEILIEIQPPQLILTAVNQGRSSAATVPRVKNRRGVGGAGGGGERKKK